MVHHSTGWNGLIKGGQARKIKHVKDVGDHAGENLTTSREP